MLGFAMGQLLPVLGTTTEAIFRVSVPHLNLLWQLDLLSARRGCAIVPVTTSSTCAR